MQKNVRHIKKHLISSDVILPFPIKNNFTNFENILNTWGSNYFFLKMDIEGNEYRILDHIIQNQTNMLGMTIEFHDCDLMCNKIKNFIEKLDLDLVHIHVNNFCDITTDGFPTVLELTFSPKIYNQARESNEFNFPLEGIDQPNNKDIEDKSISFF